VFGHSDQHSAYAVAFITVGVLALLATAIISRLRPAAGQGLATTAGARA
jgi:hypothetical protein